MPIARRLCSIALAILATPTIPLLRAQDDLRDVITLRDGPALRGRVFARYEPDAITVQRGRRRQRIPLASVVGMDTLRDRVREFFFTWDRLPDNPKHRWYAAQRAASRGLHDLARLAAMDIALRDPDHQGAHEMLGHRLVRGRWLWPSDDGWKPLDALEKDRSDWQHAWRIASEHFVVRCNADLRRVVDALWDLERFHLAWFDRFGEALRLYEVVDPKLEMWIWRDERRFLGHKTVPGPNARKTPFFNPGGGRDGLPAISHTYFADAGDRRPARLFEVATSHLIFATVGDCPNFNSGYRPAAWAELGLALYLERSMTGPAGKSTLGAWRIDPADARTVLARPERNLGHVSRYDSKKYWGGVSDENVFEWPAAELAVAFLLESKQQSGLRRGFFDYLLEVLRTVKGTSSSALDRNLGQPIERLDAAWRAWITAQN